MNRKFLVFGIVFALTLTASADYRAKTRMTASGHSFDSTVMVKGARQRTEMQLAPNMTMTTVYQCDQKRSIQINDRAKTYMILADATSSDAEEGAAPAEKAEASRPTRSQRGGVVTITSNMAETGAKKDILGHQAREVKMNMTVEATPESCSGAHTKMSSDGWYIDLPLASSSCASPERVAMRMHAQQSKCQDQLVFKRTGSAKLGYPMNVTTTIEGDNGKSTTFTQETLELSTTSLDDKLFDVPAGYKQVNSYAALMGMGSIGDMMRAAAAAGQTSKNPKQEDMTGDAGPKAPAQGNEDDDENASRNTRPSRPGTAPQSTSSSSGSGKVRIGVAAIADSGSSGLSIASLVDHLKNSLQEMGAEVVTLEVNSKDANPQSVADAARQQHCDYFLLTEVNGVKAASSAKKKFGGMLSRATGVSMGEGNSQADIKYKLFAVADPSAHLDTTASAGGDSAEQAAGKALDREAGAVMERIAKDQHH